MKGIGSLTSVLLLTSCGIQTKETQQQWPEFHDVGQGARLLLRVPGSADPQEVAINYFPSVNEKKTPLTVRMSDGNAIVMPFQDGASVRRKPGEILEKSLYRLERNPDLPADITIGQLKAAGFIYGYWQERDEVDMTNLHGLPVIVETQNILKADNKIPIETNPDYSERGADVYRASLDPRGVKEFSPGYALGSYRDGIFNVYGFAPIADAFVRAS